MFEVYFNCAKYNNKRIITKYSKQAFKNICLKMQASRKSQISAKVMQCYVEITDKSSLVYLS